MPTKTVIDLTVNLKAFHKKEDETFFRMESELTKQAEKIMNADSKQEALEEALSLEYLIVVLRTKINESISSAKATMMMDVTDNVKAICNARQQLLIQKAQRLTDLREDLNSLQKLAYTVKNTF